VLKGGLKQSQHVMRHDFSKEEVEDMLSEEMFAEFLQDSLLELVKKLETKISSTLPQVKATANSYKQVVLHFENASTSTTFKNRVVGHPISSGHTWGKTVFCESNAIVTE
jgi:hypothetical protein